MSLTARCPGCQKGYKVPPSAGGKAVTCKACGTKFRLPLAEASFDAPEPTRPPPLAYATPPRRPAPQVGLIDLGGREDGLATLLILAAALPALGIGAWQATKAPQPGMAVAGLVTIVFCFVAVIVPLALLGVWGAGRMLGFRLPERPLLYLAACFVTPTACGFVGRLLAGPKGSAIAGVVGLLLSFVVFLALFRLRLGQAALAYLLGAVALIPGFIVSGIIGAIILFAMAGVMGKPAKPAGGALASGGGAAAASTPNGVDSTLALLEQQRQQREANAARAAEMRERQDRQLREMRERNAAALRAADGGSTFPRPPAMPPAPQRANPVPSTPPTTVPSRTLTLADSPAVAASAVWAGGDVLSVIHPAAPVKFIAQVTVSGADHTLVLHDPTTLETVSQKPLPPGGMGKGGYALSPDGSKLARLIDFPRLQLQVLSTDTGEATAAFDLDATGADPSVAGFLGDGRVLVLRQSAFWRGVQVFDLGANKQVAQQELVKPTMRDKTLLLHPDGRQFVVFGEQGRGGGAEALYLYRPTGAKLKTVPVTQVSPGSGATRVGACYKPGGDEIAALYTRGSGDATQGIVFRWDSRNGGFLGETPLTGVDLHAPFFEGEALAWVGDKWVVYGRSVVDPATGKALGGTGLDDPAAATTAGDAVLLDGGIHYDHATAAVRVK